MGLPLSEGLTPGSLPAGNGWDYFGGNFPYLAWEDAPVTQPTEAQLAAWRQEIWAETREYLLRGEIPPRMILPWPALRAEDAKFPVRIPNDLDGILLHYGLPLGFDLDNPPVSPYLWAPWVGRANEHDPGFLLVNHVQYEFRQMTPRGKARMWQLLFCGALGNKAEWITKTEIVRFHLPPGAQGDHTVYSWTGSNVVLPPEWAHRREPERWRGRFPISHAGMMRYFNLPADWALGEPPISPWSLQPFGTDDKICTEMEENGYRYMAPIDRAFLLRLGLDRQLGQNSDEYKPIYDALKWPTDTDDWRKCDVSDRPLAAPKPAVRAKPGPVASQVASATPEPTVVEKPKPLTPEEKVELVKELWQTYHNAVLTPTTLDMVRKDLETINFYLVISAVYVASQRKDGSKRNDWDYVRSILGSWRKSKYDGLKSHELEEKLGWTGRGIFHYSTEKGSVRDEQQ